MTYHRRPYLDNDRASIEHSRFIKQPKSRLAADAARKLRDILVAVGYFGRLGTSRRLRIDIDGLCRHSFRIFQVYMLETLRICPNPPYLAGDCVSW